MPLPIQALCDLVAQHSCTFKESTTQAYKVEVNEFVWRAQGALKTTADNAEEAFAQATFFVDGLTAAAGTDPAFIRSIGAVADPRDIGDAVVWRGTFNVAYPQ